MKAQPVMIGARLFRLSERRGCILPNYQLITPPIPTHEIIRGGLDRSPM